MLSLDDVQKFGISAQRQILEKLGQQTHTGAASKYNAKKADRNGIRFDSQKEARRYDELLFRLRDGRIQDLKLQPQFTLQESYVTPEGKRVRAIRYVADFSYFDCDLDMEVVEDVKSPATKTRVYEIKKKLLMERWGIEVQEV